MTPTHLESGPLVSLRAVWPHHGVAADRVRALKYGDRSAAVSALADAMAPLAPAVDLVTWCPASPSARSARGFDQSELLARAIGHRLRVPVRRLLRRDRRDRPQTERDRAGRLAGPALRSLRRLRGAPAVLVVDDVTTTGTTLAVAAAVLASAGAGSVHGLVATRAPGPTPTTLRGRSDTDGNAGVRSSSQPSSGGYGWTSPSAHGT